MVRHLRGLRALPFAAGVAIVGAASGCVEIHGGAVEVAWSLFAQDGAACCPDNNPCLAAGAQTIRLHLAPTAGGPEQTSTFSCTDNQGATTFSIAPDHYTITLDAVDCHATLVATGPAPVERQVIQGEVVELGAIGLTVRNGNDVQCIAGCGQAKLPPCPDAGP